MKYILLVALFMAQVSFAQDTTHSEGHKATETCQHCKGNCTCEKGKCTCPKTQEGETCQHCKDGHKAAETCQHCKDGHKAAETCQHCKGHKSSSMQDMQGHSNMGHHPSPAANATPDGAGLVPDAKLKEALKGVLDAYLAVKNALVADNAADASQQAATLKPALSKVEMTKLNAAQHQTYMPLAAQIEESAAQIARTKDIKAQRAAFMLLSEAATKFAQTFKVAEAPVYQQFCPMANQGKGASWISTEKAIKNPYFGKSMLTCGQVKATLQ